MPKARVHTGVELDFDVTGRDDGVPLLFIHGGYGGPGTTIFGAARQLEGVFGDEVRLIRYSRRNAGASEYVLTTFDLPDVAADAAGLLDHLGVERAIVVGSSAGGPVALDQLIAELHRVPAPIPRQQLFARHRFAGHRFAGHRLVGRPHLAT